MLIIAVVAIVLIGVGKVFFSGPLPVLQVAPETVFHVADGVNLTNTLFATWVTLIVLLLLFRSASTNMKMVPTGVQALMEFVVEWFLGLVESIAGKRYARSFFPLIATVFFFVLANAWLGLLPGYGTIGIVHHAHGEQQPVPFTSIGPISVIMPGTVALPAETHAEHGEVIGVLTPFLRAANTDLNTPLALAIITFIFVEWWGIKVNGAGYFKKFFNFSGVVPAFVGGLELVSELVRLVSFTFRLFGNMFAGEVLLAVMVFLVPWVLVVPFYGLEIFVGLVQAVVFAALNLVFVTMAVAGHGDGHAEEHAEQSAHPVAHGAAEH